ncbi:MAG: beta strand repeat-containing protein, partial [Psychrobium sp.]
MTITLTDSQGNQIVVENVTVAQDGSFSVDNVDVSSLSDGQISASVNVVDVNNQPVEAQSGDELDTTAPATPIVALNDANNDGFINFVEREAGVDATITLNDPNLNVGDTIEVVLTIGNTSTTSNILVTQEVIDNQNINVVIDENLLSDDIVVDVAATVIDDKGNRSETATDSATVDINVPGGDKDQSNQSQDAPTVNINEQIDDDIIDDNEASDLTARINLPQIGTEVGDSLIVTINGTEQPPITITQELIDSGFTTIAIPPSEITDGQNVEVTAKVTDPAGNSSSEGTDSATVDLSTPTSNVGPITDIEEANNTVSENASIAESTGVHADATDPDGDDVSYTLSDDADGRFTIDPTSGEITVAKELDFDNGDGGNHTVTVVATSTDGSTSTQNFTIEVTDADGSTPGQGDTDNIIGPVTDIEEANNTVSENASIGDSTGVHADATDSDGDDVSYTLSDDADGRFTIDPTSGEITVAKELDFDNGDGGNHVVTVVATSTDGSTSTQNFTIEVTDADSSTPGQGDTDNAIGPVTDIEEANNTVSENASIGDSTGIHADARDPDGDNVSYTLSDDAEGRFTIDPATGEIKVAKELNFENGDNGNHVVTVIATSTDGSTSTQNFTISVTDADGSTPGQGDTDNVIGPVTDIEEANNTVSENASIGDSTGVHADATDPDGDNVSYTLSDNADGRFTIDPTSGEITVAKELDFDNGDGGNHVVTVVATSTDGSTSTQNFTIEVTNINDAPIADDASITVDEESTGTDLGIAAPTDSDSTNLTITVTGLPTLGTVTLADGTTVVTNGQTLTSAQLTGLKYNAPADYNDGDTVGNFTYSVNDNSGAANAVSNGTVTIGVNAINDAPIADDASITVDEES